MRMLFGEIRPARVLATHAHALALPSMQRAREWSGRGMPQVDRAVEEEPVGCQHVKMEIPAVVPAACEVGEEAARVVVVARIDAKLRMQGGVHEVDEPPVIRSG